MRPRGERRGNAETGGHGDFSRWAAVIPPRIAASPRLPLPAFLPPRVSGSPLPRVFPSR